MNDWIWIIILNLLPFLVGCCVFGWQSNKEQEQGYLTGKQAFTPWAYLYGWWAIDLTISIVILVF